ncbi:MAG: hypothetical protein HKN47_08340, partial [Pirellulaceae bacterium]|nr:hypothetical protein [Pirellulaceae bacterium]
AKLNSLDEEVDPIKRSHLEQRLANLRARIEHQNTVSPARLHTLTNKLRARIGHEAIEQYVQTCRDRVGAIIRDRYQMKDVPNELLTPPLDAVLTDILKLTQPMKELGLRLIFETLNRSTRRFDGEPANMEFCNEIRGKGVNIDVWLGDSFETTAKTADDVPYHLRFTRDVIDFLLMGFHFGTCLSPGDFNFFSTVANAVDVNKRVVYGKTKSGKIVGRCLFAMNDAGEILTYHRYAHEAEDKFGEAVDGFANELAVAMNSRLANRGAVRNLVAKNWYDDGAIGADIGDTNDDLIRRLISEAEPNSLYQGMKAILSADEICNRIDELTTMPEIENQPEMLCGLLSSLAQEDALTRSQRFVVARAAYSRAVHEVAIKTLERIPAKRIIAIIKQTRCDYCSCFHGIGSYREVFAMMIDFNPSIAIRVMRASRNPRASDDLKDYNPTRRRALAKAHSKLGRAHLAEQLARANA